ncbi:DNA-binding SARP family transcriptional activator [Streptomyces sp. Ag109_O5-1]|uniref:AfsR/SARP family transcriptional regulator n=1 Tax=Streptomyces TaxID=1883 RepID=UPI000F5090D1|nr:MULTISPECIES: AfsR/SARP family transcriptional regulator [Streptomyces]RPE37391.1 DNA-binding SARP family transcriptional activator [Streptomyces sp. Ag109_O5-1]
MDIGLLGALDVRESGVSIAPTAPKPRQLLALLALRADQVVPVPTLIEELWAGTPPRSARTTLQTYVLQLRELIATALREGAGREHPEAGNAEDPEARNAKDVLTTLPGGYLLASGGGTSDIREFERLSELGYRAMEDENFACASRTLRQALDLWTATPFVDVHTGAHLAMEARRLEESRLCALDQRIEADLRLGRHRELLAELTVLTSRYRSHENLHAQFMLALHRSGRRGEALHVYQQLRTLLVRELGLEPSARLRRLQYSILAATADGPGAPQQYDDLAGVS